ncbi:hypothetical protein TDB9533_00247 [Thalassocella blandensis]|nr:hypothetical protein TDB9533_00247 [Thalassocella blandensis]
MRVVLDCISHYLFKVFVTSPVNEFSFTPISSDKWRRSILHWFYRYPIAKT